jgi:hypothetical protein
MTGLAKTFRLGTIGADGSESQHRYGDLWDIEQTTGPSRLVVAPSGNHLDCMIELSRQLQEPFGILFVLLVSRCGNAPGRYQSPEPTSREDTEYFLRRYAEFFQNDGRSHLWLMSLPDEATIVYDNHDVLYAYGPIDSYVRVLERRGLRRAPVRFPVPHTHCYNEPYDPIEEAVLGAWNWRHFPLAPDDEL